MSTRWLAAAIVSLIVVAEIPAHAYVDAGTGSYALQIAVAAIWGVGFAFRGAIRRVVARFFRSGDKDTASSTDE